MDNGTLANLTANVTGTGDAGGVSGWILGILSWLWTFTWNMSAVMGDIMKQNPIVGLLIVIMLIILMFWVLTLSQVGAAQAMKGFLYIGLIIIVAFIIWFLQGSFDLTGMFSGWLQGTVGMDVGNTTNGTVEVVKNVTDNGGTNFWT